MPICPIFGLVSWICPDIDKLHYFTVRILILTCWSPNTKSWTPCTRFALAMATIEWLELSLCFHLLNRWRPGSARMPLQQALPGCRWGAHDAPSDLRVGLPTACKCGARILRLMVLKLWSPYVYRPNQQCQTVKEMNETNTLDEFDNVHYCSRLSDVFTNCCRQVTSGQTSCLSVCVWRPVPWLRHTRSAQMDWSEATAT